MQAIRKQIINILSKPFPQNFLIRKPYWGTLFFLIVIFVFVIIYRPLEIRASNSLSFGLTILAYCTIISFSELLAAIIISKTNCFSTNNNWTIGNEFVSILLLLTTLMISTYFAGFVMEPPDPRWNFSTFFDSAYKALFIGVIPVILPSLVNIRYAFAKDTFQTYELNETNESEEVLLKIESKAKKEDLSFYPHEFVYAESEGNYVVFHLVKDDKPRSVTIRNSISEIETQLCSIPYFMRTHRAYIVNLHKITSRKGNALGYQLSLDHCKDTVPVSRQNARKFEDAMK